MYEMYETTYNYDCNCVHRLYFKKIKLKFGIGTKIGIH